MTLTLVVALLSGQVIYEWVDAKGQSHFTDDRGSIPEGVKPRETKGAEVSVVESSPPEAPAADAVDGGVAEPEGQPAEQQEEQPKDACAVARDDLARAEERAAAASAARAQLEEEASARCGQVLLTHGQGSFAQCMAGRAEALTRDDAAVKKQVEVARETLRVAEAQGCP